MFFTTSGWLYGQISPCDCTANVPAGNILFSSLTWTGTGCPSSGSPSYTGNLCVNLVNGTNLIMNKDFTVNGGFGISTSGSNPTFTINSGFTLNVTGDMGDNSNNNTNFVVNGNLVVGGTLYGKNSNAFAGSGTVTAGGLDFNQPPTCSPCNIDWNVTTCEPAGSAFCTSVLPVTLLFFEANPYPDYVELKWATASELNFDRFIIEKTRDGSTFTEIGSRQGAGVSTVRIDYSFTDEQVMLGRTYYRLKAIDFDGYTEYFGLVSVHYDGVSAISVFPNPAPSGDVNIYFNYFSDEPLYYKIMDVSGAEVVTGTIKRTGFDNQYTLDKPLAPGLYYLIASPFDTEKKVIRFVVN